MSIIVDGSCVKPRFEVKIKDEDFSFINLGVGED